MLGVYRYMIPFAIMLLLLVFTLVSCAKNEKREVTVQERQHESEVIEEQPGEMVVE